MTYGKYKHFRIKNIPSKYLLSARTNRADAALVRFIANNEQLLESLDGKPIEKFRPATGFICDKNRYDTKEDALKALARIRMIGNGEHNPTRSYECEFCGKFHITHLAVEIYEK